MNDIVSDEINSMTQYSEPRPLFPSQARALAELDTELARASCVVLVGRAGTGKSEIAKALLARGGAGYLCLEDYLRLASAMPHDKWGERVFSLMHEALSRHQTLIIDDYSFSLMWEIDRERAELEKKRLRERARVENKSLIFMGRTDRPQGEPDVDDERERLYLKFSYDTYGMAAIMLSPYLQPDDLEFLARLRLGGADASVVDFETLHMHAASLTPRSYFMVLDMLKESGTAVSTAALLALLSEHVLHDNIRLDEVEALSFEDLPGTEEIAQALEDHVVMPFLNPDEARAMGAKARRGVMLFGPPGTGKTSIGRALAHRMKGKFFLIDGSIPTEPPHEFLGRIMAIIERAIRNAPCVLFIDDADSLFPIPYVAGVVRKLLSLLDGMESVNAGKVCVMMTVMDPIHIPDALVRSGRVELWLETKTPDEAERTRIFARWKAQELPGHDVIDNGLLAKESAGFTPADIRRVMGDARLLYAQDIKAGLAIRQSTDYALEAIRDIATMRGRMAGALTDDSLRLGAASMKEAVA